MHRHNGKLSKKAISHEESITFLFTISTGYLILTIYSYILPQCPCMPMSTFYAPEYPPSFSNLAAKRFGKQDGEELS